MFPARAFDANRATSPLDFSASRFRCIFIHILAIVCKGTTWLDDLCQHICSTRGASSATHSVVSLRSLAFDSVTLVELLHQLDDKRSCARHQIAASVSVCIIDVFITLVSCRIVPSPAELRCASLDRQFLSRQVPPRCFCLVRFLQYGVSKKDVQQFSSDK